MFHPYKKPASNSNVKSVNTPQSKPYMKFHPNMKNNEGIRKCVETKSYIGFVNQSDKTTPHTSTYTETTQFNSNNSSIHGPQVNQPPTKFKQYVPFHYKNNSSEIIHRPAVKLTPPLSKSNFNGQKNFTESFIISDQLAITDQSEVKLFDNKKNEEYSTIHLIGTVEYVIQWYKMINHKIDALSTFQVIGWLECTKQGKHWCQKMVFVRGDSGPILQCIYYEIDRALPLIYKGQLLSCTGRMLGANKLQIFDIQTLTEEDKIGAQRAIFLSQRIVTEIAKK